MVLGDPAPYLFCAGGIVSKGSKQRPRSVPADKFSDNWDRIFGKPSSRGGGDDNKKARGVSSKGDEVEALQER